jgi:hypothetical protein
LQGEVARKATQPPPRPQDKGRETLRLHVWRYSRDLRPSPALTARLVPSTVCVLKVT